MVSFILSLCRQSYVNGKTAGVKFYTEIYILRPSEPKNVI